MIFSDWLLEEMEKRGWDQPTLAAKAEISVPMVSMMLSGQRNPGVDTCKKLASAFGYPPEQVYRVTNIMDELPAGTGGILVRIAEYTGRLDKDDQRDLMNYAHYKFLRKSRLLDKLNFDILNSDDPDGMRRRILEYVLSSEVSQDQLQKIFDLLDD